MDIAELPSEPIPYAGGFIDISVYLQAGVSFEWRPKSDKSLEEKPELEWTLLAPWASGAPCLELCEGLGALPEESRLGFLETAEATVIACLSKTDKSRLYVFFEIDTADEASNTCLSEFLNKQGYTRVVVDQLPPDMLHVALYERVINSGNIDMPAKKKKKEVTCENKAPDVDASAQVRIDNLQSELDNRIQRMDNTVMHMNNRFRNFVDKLDKNISSEVERHDVNITDIMAEVKALQENFARSQEQQKKDRDALKKLQTQLNQQKQLWTNELDRRQSWEASIKEEIRLVAEANETRSASAAAALLERLRKPRVNQAALIKLSRDLRKKERRRRSESTSSLSCSSEVIH